MKTITAGLQTRIQQEATSLCRLWTITLTDNTVYRYTDTASNVLYSGDVYEFNPGVTVSAIETSLGGGASNGTIEIAFAVAGIEEAAARRGAIDDAQVTVLEVDFLLPTAGAIPLFSGKVTSIYFTDLGYARLDVKGSAFDLNKRFMKRYSETCRNVFGDSNCGVDLEALGVAVTVDAVASSNQAFNTRSLAQAAGFFDYGTVRFETGANAGLVMEVLAHTREVDPVNDPAEWARVGLALGLPRVIAVGDTLTVFPGCNKTVKADCLDRYDNVRNFRGEPFVPVGPITVVTNTSEARLVSPEEWERLTGRIAFLYLEYAG